MNILATQTNDENNFSFVDVLRINKLIDQNNVEIVLSIANFIERKFTEASILRTKLTPNTLRELVERNGGVCQNAKKLCEYIQTKVAKLLIESTHCEGNISDFMIRYTTLGWTHYREMLVFNADTIITEGQVISSQYIGQYAVTKTGCIEEIKSLYNNHIVDNVPLQGIMCMAAAATVLPFSNMMWRTNLYNPINHLMGDSTTGKSSATALFTSFGSSPVKVNGFMLSFLSTLNALVKEIGNNCGYPCAVDEFSTGLSRKNWSDFVYMLANGRDKARCTGGGAGLQKVEHFETVFLTNGEMSILNICNKNEGIRARLFEYQIESWTKDADDANEIIAVVKDNYGLVTPLLARELLQCGKYWKNCFEYWRHRVRARIKGEKILLGIGDRIADFVALYMCSCELLSHVLDVPMDVDSVYDFFFLHIIIKNAEDANLGIRAYEAIISYFAKNRDKYPNFVEFYEGEGCGLDEGQEGFVVSSRRKHTVNGVDYTEYAVFLPDILEEALSRRGFADPKIAMKALQKEGLLRTKDGKRVYLERRINGIMTKVYAVWVDVGFF